MAGVPCTRYLIHRKYFRMGRKVVFSEQRELVKEDLVQEEDIQNLSILDDIIKVSISEALDILSSNQITNRL
ncbi:Hypothetical predicted protein [Octopus vulgaris]|uniref:Uncharacterized protein n=1 Tax=Octopus vulgaris TaxID=6645 RepID=A0AA36BAN2_OCTVU|nr:Hypothetical predicted protein [Octopus vulgaris]